jgi:hypothetical protein
MCTKLVCQLVTFNPPAAPKEQEPITVCPTCFRLLSMHTGMYEEKKHDYSACY